jgi:hypothetical protein
MASPINPSVSSYQEDSTLTTTQKTITNSVIHNLPTSSVFFLPGSRAKPPIATASALVVRGAHFEHTIREHCNAAVMPCSLVALKALERGEGEPWGKDIKLGHRRC